MKWHNMLKRNSANDKNAIVFSEKNAYNGSILSKVLSKVNWLTQRGINGF